MSSRVTPQQYGQAVLENVQGSAYPESEDVISAELPPSALPEVSKLIEQAREDVKVGRSLGPLRMPTKPLSSRPLLGETAERVPRTSMVGSRKPSCYVSISKGPKR